MTVLARDSQSFVGRCIPDLELPHSSFYELTRQTVLPWNAPLCRHLLIASSQEAIQWRCLRYRSSVSCFIVKARAAFTRRCSYDANQEWEALAEMGLRTPASHSFSGCEGIQVWNSLLYTTGLRNQQGMARRCMQVVVSHWAGQRFHKVPCLLTLLLDLLTPYLVFK